MQLRAQASAKLKEFFNMFIIERSIREKKTDNKLT